MSDEKMEDLGCLPHGTHLFRKRNTAGGWTYYSDETGCGAVVWDTCLVNESTLLAAILCEHHRKYMEFMISNGWKPTPEMKRDMEIENMAATGGSFLGPTKNGAIDGPCENGSQTKNEVCSHVVIGDVIYLHEDECLLLGCSPGEYVVEDARDSSGWAVQARKLDDTGRYCASNPFVRFQQGVGYIHSLPSVKVIRHMQRIFV